jgi:vacuolar-type H+-ATPase subunit E/Vma4
LSAAEGPFAGLLDAVLEDVRAEVGRIHDRAANEARALVEAAEAHVEGLERAARELGEVRGRAAEAALERDADAEVANVAGAAFDRLAERFLQRVETALAALPGTPRYGEALSAWARAAARAIDRPADVTSAPRDRERVYDALLAAGARDFRVLADPRVRAGFVVRDGDGRTILDRRPDALVRERADALRDLLRAAVPPFRS